MKIPNGTKCIVHSTGSNLIDNIECKIVGIATYFGDCGGNIYIVKPLSNKIIDGYETFCISDSCIKFN